MHSNCLQALGTGENWWPFFASFILRSHFASRKFWLEDLRNFLQHPQNGAGRHHLSACHWLWPGKGYSEGSKIRLPGFLLDDLWETPEGEPARLSAWQSWCPNEDQEPGVQLCVRFKRDNEFRDPDYFWRKCVNNWAVDPRFFSNILGLLLQPPGPEHDDDSSKAWHCFFSLDE